MLPNINDVSIGTIDGLTLEERPRTKWACVRVQSLRISHHADIYRGSTLGLLVLGLEIYFPNSGLAKHPLSHPAPVSQQGLKKSGINFGVLVTRVNRVFNVLERKVLLVALPTTILITPPPRFF
jgi:hypothetical protein